MKSLNIQWLIDNFRWMYFIALLVFGLTALIIGYVRTPEQLRSNELKVELENKLVTEMKELNLPPKTAVNNFENMSKSHSILVITRYRTELDEVEFVQLIKSELERKGWTRDINNKNGIIAFCRGLVDANIYSDSNGLFGKDNGNYFKLHFVAGLDGVFESKNLRPENCR